MPISIVPLRAKNGAAGSVDRNHVTAGRLQLRPGRDLSWRQAQHPRSAPGEKAAEGSR